MQWAATDDESVTSVDLHCSTDGGATFRHGRSPALTTAMVRHRGTDGAMQIYDTEMLGLNVAGGGYKGFGQGLIVEVMCAALAGAWRGPQMGSFMANDGKPIGCGQFFIALDPKAFSGGAFAKQITALAKSITSQDGARLPNARRAANQRRLAKEGLPIDRALYDRLKSFA
ncbi:MAG: Ldh family oxidoreductase [Rhodospirillales bacterium]|nr:Ldh family oxidoreductase [Rhodospirillales bacterium]